MSGVLLVGLLVVPVLGALATLFVPKPRLVAIGAAAVTLAASLLLLNGRNDGTWHEVDAPWVSTLDLRFHLGVDGISWPLIALTTLTTLLCTVYTLVKHHDNVRTMLAIVLALEAGILGVFLAMDVLLFFVFFEVTLAPMYALITGWGGPHRKRAATKFVLYTLFGSVLLLVGLLIVVLDAGTADITELSTNSNLGRTSQIAAFVLLLVAFAVKSPLWPLHTWLPDAHTEAPTIGSVLLAGVLLKMGTYGLIRLALPVLPEGARAVAPWLGAFATAAILVGGLVCLAMDELKRLIAYSSVGHMGFVLLGVATLTVPGIQAALIGNVAHGLITGLLFFLAGTIKDRYGTGQLAELGGIASNAPRLAGLFGFAAVASLGLPGLAGFWGEAFAVVGSWLAGGVFKAFAVLAALGAALAAAYFLRLLRRTMVGPPIVQSAKDLSAGELAVLAPLAALTVAVGLAPNLVLGLTSAPVEALVEAVSR